MSGSSPNSLVMVVRICTSAMEDQLATVSRLSDSFNEPCGISRISSRAVLNADRVISLQSRARSRYSTNSFSEVRTHAILRPAKAWAGSGTRTKVAPIDWLYLI
jgi:hypothetical protein